MIGLRFFPLKSADVRGPGTRDEPLRTSAWEATRIQTKMSKVFSDQKGPKTLPFGRAYLYGLYKGIPPPGPDHFHGC